MMPQLPDLSNVPDLPLALSLLIVFFLLLGSLFTFIGALGLAFFRNFYDRLHMPTLGTTVGVAATLFGTVLYASYMEGHIIMRDVLLVFFLCLTAPISVMMLSRAATMRDFTQNWHDTSDNMFWQLARDETVVTDKTDVQVEKEIDKQEKQEQEAAVAAPIAAGLEIQPAEAEKITTESAPKNVKTARHRKKNSGGRKLKTP